MPSDNTAFVWAYLPGDVLPTLCGRYEHAKTGAGAEIGRFVYGATYLGNKQAVSIDPIALPLRSQQFSTTALKGVFGALSDAIPDDWGQYVINSRLGEQDYPVGFMLHTVGDAVGNLAFSSAADSMPAHESPVSMDFLEEARAIILNLEQGRPVSPELEGRVHPINTAMGGARPKITVAHEGAQWLAKFASRKDHPLLPYAQTESAMLALAPKCGVHAAPAFVAQGDVLLVRRFDRSLAPGPDAGWQRHAFLSARTVFFSNPDLQAYSVGGNYLRLANELTRYSANPKEDREQLYYRMVFNACISNTDDHDRNHGLLADPAKPGAYRLSPAYDLVPKVHGTKRRYLAMTAGDDGAIITRENLLSACETFGLDHGRAARILAEVEDGVQTHWRSALEQAGLSPEAIQMLTGCFDPLPKAADVPRPPAGRKGA